MLKFSMLLILAIVSISACTQSPAGNVISNETTPPNETTPSSFTCKGSADCFSGIVTRVVDGDTLDVDDIRIRLTLVYAPESYEPGGAEATQFLLSICPIGSTVLVDEDDGQTEGSYNRLIGVVYCNDKNLNAELIGSDYAWIYEQFCEVSEFANEAWAKDCNYQPAPNPPQQTNQTNQTSNCDSSYPTVCIPLYPPDLDCGEITYRNFQVLQPDPHGFDGD